MARTWTHSATILAVVLVLGVGPSTVGGAADPAPVARPPAGDPIDHATWTRLLERYVDGEGRVAYRRLRREARADLERYLAELAEARPDDMSRNAQIAFWINAYNAGTITAVLEGYAPESTFGRTRMFRWYSFPVAGRKRTLDEIEHEILRPRFREPRMHFALVCGATSCPRLRREAYQGERLDAQLDDQARSFINDPQRNRIDPAGERVALSRIFDWFADDFAARGGPAGVAAAYVETPAQAELLRARADRLEFLEYDWTLNAQDGEGPAS